VLEKSIIWIVGLLFIISGIFGYGEEAQITLLTFAVILNPFYFRYKIKKCTGKTNNESATESELKKLQSFKIRFYTLITAGELLFLSILLHMVLSDDRLLLLIGLAFGFAFIALVTCTSSICPRCKQFFFREEKTPSTVIVSPTSIGVHYFPLHVSITDKCKCCGIPWSIDKEVINE